MVILYIIKHKNQITKIVFFYFPANLKWHFSDFPQIYKKLQSHVRMTLREAMNFSHYTIQT